MHERAMLDHGTPDELVAVLRRMHTDVTEVGRVPAEAGAQQLVLPHLIAVHLGG